MNKFYLYKKGDKFIKINELKIGLSNNIDNASFWTSKKSAKSWKTKIEYKYTDVILVEAGFKIKD
jgi:hypothetical protein